MRSSAFLLAAALLASPCIASAETIADANHWVPVFATKNVSVDMRRVAAAAAAGAELPMWSSSVVSPLDGKTYPFTMIGTNPQTSPVTTNIPYLPIALIVKFSNGATLDPTKPGCGDTVPVTTRFFSGPNFVDVPLTSNGIDVGTAQVDDGLQRAEFWNYTAGTNYHVHLKSAEKLRVITVNAPAGSIAVAGVCSGANHDIGEIPINAYDALVQKIDKEYAKTTQLPLILTYNVFETQSGNCCILGYHSTYTASSGATQVYSVGAYNDAGIFNVPIEDIHAWTHEIGEAFNDPFGTNIVPAWGHIGQQSKCQNNLEVGDPLTGTPFALTYKGFAYHPQELVFFSWFFRTPSIGTGSEYSFEGTFTTPQGTCTP
jgi:hypothetical protein